MQALAGSQVLVSVHVAQVEPFRPRGPARGVLEQAADGIAYQPVVVSWPANESEYRMEETSPG